MPDSRTPNMGQAGLLMGAPERAFVVALRYGWAWLRDHPQQWDSLLRQADAVELADIKALFGAGGKYDSPIIRVGFPMAQAVAPQITVLTETETEESSILGDELNEIEDFPLEHGLAHGSLRSQIVVVNVVASHPDTVLYLSRAVDAILTAHGMWFITGAGMNRAEFGSISACMPEGRDPDMLWSRQIRWNTSGVGGAILPIPPPTAVDVRAAIAGGRVQIG